MTSKVYNKPPLTLDQQAELLLNRGLQGVSKQLSRQLAIFTLCMLGVYPKRLYI